MATAANTQGNSSLRSGQVATTTAAQALEAFQTTAANACFKDATLTTYLISTAQRGGDFQATAKQLLEHATLIHSLGVTGSGVDTKSVLKDLLGMVRKFHDAPVALDTLQLNKNEKDYKALKNIGTRLDGLIDASGARPKLLEDVQIHLVNTYVTAGLREGIEQRFGQLDAQGAHDVMSFGTASDAAWQALDAALGQAVRNQTQQGFGEFFRNTLNVLDLQRAGSEKAPEAPRAPDQPDSPVTAPTSHLPQLLSLLEGIRGNGGSPIIFAPNVTANGGDATAAGGLSKTEVQEMIDKAVKTLMSSQGPNKFETVNTENTETQDAQTQTEDDNRARVTHLKKDDAEVYKKALANTNKTQASSGSDDSDVDSALRRHDSDRSSAKGNGDWQFTSPVNVIPRVTSSRTGGSNLRAVQSVSIQEKKLSKQPSASKTIRHNTIPLPPSDNSNNLATSRPKVKSDAAVASVNVNIPPAEPVQDKAFFLKLLKKGQVKVEFRNLPRDAPPNFMGNFVRSTTADNSNSLQAQLQSRISNRNIAAVHPSVELPNAGRSQAQINLDADRAAAVQLSAFAHDGFKIVKQQIKDGASIETLKETPAGQALFEEYPQLEVKFRALLNQQSRVIDADPVNGKKRAPFIGTPGSNTSIAGNPFQQKA